MRNPNVKREPANVRCIICGAPLAECSIGGLHGIIRDKAAKATA
jgi:ribosomal protein S27E